MQGKPKVQTETTPQDKQRNVWGAGNYSEVGTTLQIVGESLAESLDLRSGQAVLDVASGNGNFSLAAARRYTAVTSLDIVDDLLENGRQRAAAEKLTIDFRQADAAQMPYADATFDVVGSVFGVMFVPNQQQAARELQRVVTPGGKIGLASWTADSFIGRLFKAVRTVAPSDAPSPMTWGCAESISAMFEPQAAHIAYTKQQFTFRFYSTAQWLENFKNVYGPLKTTYAGLDEPRQRALDNHLKALLDELNISNDATMVIPGDYLECVITQK